MPSSKLDYPTILRHSQGCHLDEDCLFENCFQMKLSMLHLYKCKRKDCEEISCKALAAIPPPKSPPPAHVEDKIKRAIIISDMLETSRQIESTFGLKRPIPVYASEISNVTSQQVPGQNNEKQAIEFFCRAYIDIFSRIAKAGKG